MKSQFTLDLDSDTWCAIHSALVAQAMLLPANESESAKTAIESLELQALANDLMTKEDLRDWRETVIQQLQH